MYVCSAANFTHARRAITQGKCGLSEQLTFIRNEVSRPTRIRCNHSWRNIKWLPIPGLPNNGSSRKTRPSLPTKVEDNLRHLCTFCP